MNSENEIVRVLRVVEYVGPRKHVEEQVAKSIHGERRISKPEGDVVIRAGTVGLYPEVLNVPPCNRLPSG